MTEFMSEYRPSDLTKQKLEKYDEMNRSGMGLQALIQLKTDMSNELKTLEEDRKKLRRYNFRKLVETDALAETNSVALGLVRIEIERAIKRNKEFDHPIFSERLLAITNDTRLVTLRSQGRNCLVELNFELVAGNVDDYANAISAARDSLGIGIMPGPIASHVFYEKYYSAARLGKRIIRKRKGRGGKSKRVDVTSQNAQKYWETMYTRMANLSTLAPFWFILDQGSENLELSSNREDGYANPPVIPTGFVQNSIDAIQKSYRNSYKFISDQYQKRIDRIDGEFASLINKVTTILQEINKQIEGMRLEIKQPKQIYRIRLNTAADAAKQMQLDIIEKQKQLKEEERQALQRQAKFRIARNLIQNYLTDEERLAASKRKLNELARSLAEGQEVPSRLSLGGGVRKRTIELRKRYEELDL